jgi:hypothetical protein
VRETKTKQIQSLYYAQNKNLLVEKTAAWTALLRCMFEGTNDVAAEAWPLAASVDIDMAIRAIYLD